MKTERQAIEKLRTQYSMLTEKNILRAAMVATALLAAVLTTYCIIAIGSFFTPVHYWDQWEVVKHITTHGQFYSYLLQPHNEHIIATSKILFYLDYWLFDFSNRSLVAMIVVLHLLIGYVFAALLVGNRLSWLTLFWASIFCAAMLSLAQWENLTIGFQTQFGLTSLFAILSCVFAAHVVWDTKLSWSSFSGLVLCIPLTVFSMGNGIALVFSLVLIAMCGRAGIRRTILLVTPYTLCLAVFFLMRSSAGGADHEVAGGMIYLLRFFTAILGGTFTSNFVVASLIGSAILIAFLVIFVAVGAIPWLRRQPIDKTSVIFLAIAVFALGSAAAVTIGRNSLGPAAALTSRYATPNLLLYCSLLGVACRHSILKTRTGTWERRFICLFALLGLTATCVLTFRPANLAQLTARSDTLRTSGYFVISGIMSHDVLTELYPVPEQIRAPLEFMRTNKLNIFSPAFGLKTLGRTEIANVGDLKSCARLDVKSAFQLDETSWRLTGKIGDSRLDTAPAWMIATTLDGRVLGYAPPKMQREGAMYAFDTPVHDDGRGFDRKAYLVAQSSEGELCRSESVVDLSKSNFSQILADDAADADYEEKLSWNDTSVQLPEPAQNVEGARHVRSTWQGDDTATGTISYTLPAISGSCPDVFVGVMRGPNANGLSIEITNGEGKNERISLDAINEHRWWWLKIRSSEGCGTGTPLEVKLIDNGKQWGSWAAMTAPVALPSRAN